MTSDWSYMSLWDAISHFEYPDDFEFGNGDNDDVVFDQAWAFMLTHTMPVVHFPGFVDLEALESASAILVRSRMPAVNVNPVNTEEALTRLVEADREAIFARAQDAHVAAMMFGGTVMKEQTA